MVGEESPSLQPRPHPYNRSLREPNQNPPRPGLTLPPLRVLNRRTRNARACPAPFLMLKGSAVLFHW